MELVHWRPLRQVKTIQDDLNEFWNQRVGAPALSRWFRDEWSPAVDVRETKDKVVVSVELPGMEGEDVNLSISEDLMTIKGEKKQETEEKNEHHHQIERFYGCFQRSFRLPVSVDSEHVEASFTKGVLKVTLPKTEAAKKKEIPIKID